MIITLNKAKTLLQIGDTSKDTLIESIIPIVEAFVCDYCNTDFVDKYFDYISSNAISFDNASGIITFNNISSSDFEVGDNLRVYGSLRNDGVYTIDIITTNTITINDINSLVNESSGESIILTKTIYPKSIDLIVSQMINHILNIPKMTPGLVSEKIDDYSYSLSDFTNGYPSTVIAGLKIYRQLYKMTLSGGGLYGYR